MILCPSCGAENADGMRFCAKCGGTIADSSPTPGSWQEPSGNLYDTPGAGGSATGTGGGTSYPGTYAPPPVSYGGGYGGGAAMASTGIGGLPYAEWIDRVLAALIDGGIAVAVMIVLNIIFGVIGIGIGGIGSSLGSDALGGIGSMSCCFGFLLAGLSVLVVGIYNKVFLVSKRGFSIGQGIMKLKVVDAMGNIPQMGTLVIRLLAQVAMGFIPIIGFFLGIANALWPLWDEKKQTLHDKAAGTFVLKIG